MRKLDGMEYLLIYFILCGFYRYLGENGIYDKNFLDEKKMCILLDLVRFWMFECVFWMRKVWDL